MLPLIQIKNLVVDFPGKENENIALDDFNLDLNLGEILAVVGESGSGKSLMALTIMRLLSPSARIRSGSVHFSDGGQTAVDLLSLTQKEVQQYRGYRIAMIFQEPMTSLNPLMTCGAQVIESLMIHKKTNRIAAKREVLHLFEKVELPDPETVYTKFPHQLSGGQKQRVMIAMAISCKPALLICDEPTTALDVSVQKTILDLLKNLCRSENMGMIFITHDLGLVAGLADRVTVMLRGIVVESGPVNTVFDNPQQAYTRALLLCRPALYRKGERLPVVSDFTENRRVNDPPVRHNPPAESKSAAGREIMVCVKDLGLKYDLRKNWLGRSGTASYAIRDISFDLYQGETLGIVGESGSGKTTVGRALLGLNKPGEGKILFSGTNILELNQKELVEFRKNVQIVFQDPYSSLNPRLMVGPAIAEPFKVHWKMDSAERKYRVLELLNKVGLKTEFYNRYPHEFSGGQRQRIVIARALALNPGLVVFDESVAALDVSIQAQVLNLINDLKKDLGFTVIFISHDLSVIRYLCDRVMVMEKGRIVESGETESVYQNPQTSYTRTLIEASTGGPWDP